MGPIQSSINSLAGVALSFAHLKEQKATKEATEEVSAKQDELIKGISANTESIAKIQEQTRPASAKELGERINKDFDIMPEGPTKNQIAGDFLRRNIDDYIKTGKVISSNDPAMQKIVAYERQQAQKARQQTYNDVGTVTSTLNSYTDEDWNKFKQTGVI